METHSDIGRPGPFDFPGLPPPKDKIKLGLDLKGVLSVLDQVRTRRPRVANDYSRVVTPEGNPVALALMEEAKPNPF